MSRINAFFFIIGLFCAGDLMAAAQEPPITEDQLQERYSKAGVRAHIYPRQLIALRDAFVQKVKIWEEIHGREIHPIDLLIPHLDVRPKKWPIFKKFDTTFLIGSEEEKTAASLERKKLSRSVVVAFTTWLKASDLFAYREKKWFIWDKEKRSFITKNKYDYLFSYEIKIECSLLGCTYSRQKTNIYLSEIITCDRFGKINLPEEKKILILLMHQNYRSFPPYMHKKYNLLSSNLTEEEFDTVMRTLETDPIDLPLYGLREEPPLESRSMWERGRGIKRPTPACLMDPSAMEGEGPYIDMIPPKGFSVFAHAFPGFRDEILGFEAYGMDRGPAIYRGLMDPPPYPVVMLVDMVEEEREGEAAAAPEDEEHTRAGASASASATLSEEERVSLLRKRRTSAVGGTRV